VRDDPFAQAGAADYTIVEFQPNRGPLAAPLLTGDASGDQPDHPAANGT
jgi:hypothetical protein